MNKPVLVLFDCDGTLIDSAHNIHETLVKTFQAFDIEPPNEDETRSIIGLSLDCAISTLLKGPTDAHIANMVAYYKNIANDIRSNSKLKENLYPHIADMLKALAQMDHVILGVVTGKSRRGVKSLCVAYDFDFFHVVRTADDCPSKPAPDMVLECCAQAGIKPENTFVVGDTTYDIQMAIAAGAMPVGVTWGYNKREMLEKAGAFYIVQQPIDILNIVRGFDA